MTLPVPTEVTASTNDIMSAARWNTNVRDGINYLLNVPILSCYSVGTQSVTTSTWTALTFDTNVYDTYNGHSTSSNTSEYVAQVSGIYLVIVRSGWAANTTGIRGAAITVNGATVAANSPQVLMQTTSASEPIVEVSALVQIPSGQFVQGWGFQSSGGNLSTFANISSMQAIWIHA